MDNTSNSDFDPNASYRRKKLAQILGLNSTNASASQPSRKDTENSISSSSIYSKSNGRPLSISSDVESTTSTLQSRHTITENVNGSTDVHTCPPNHLDNWKSSTRPHLPGNIDYVSVVERITIRRKISGPIHILPDAPRRIYLPAMSYKTPRREALTGSSNFPTLRSSHHSSHQSSKYQRSEEALPRMSSSQDSKNQNGDGSSNGSAKHIQSAVTLNEYFDRRRSAPTKSRVASKYFRLPEDDNRSSQPSNATNRKANQTKPICNGLDHLNSSLQLAMNNNFKNGH